MLVNFKKKHLIETNQMKIKISSLFRFIYGYITMLIQYRNNYLIIR